MRRFLYTIFVYKLRGVFTDIIFFYFLFFFFSPFSIGTYNDSIVNDVHQSSLIGTITGTSTLGHLQSTYQPPIQINSLIKNRLALNAHQETSNHKKAGKFV